MNHPEGHAGWFRDVRAIINITETTPGLPLPRIAPDRAVFLFVGITHRAAAWLAMAEAETILRSGLLAAFFPRRTQIGSAAHYILTAVLPSGLQVDLVAMAEHFDSPAEDAPRELARSAAA